MLSKYSSVFNSTIARLHDIHVAMVVVVDHYFFGKNRKLSAAEAKDISGVLDKVAALATLLDSRMLEKQIARMRESLLDDYLCSALRDDVRELKSRLEDELDAKVFLHVPPEKAQYYDQKELFGVAVNERFPKAIRDIERAGNCLALDEGTATVFHLMRVMEVGLAALAQSLAIPYAPNWASYLDRIQKRISERYEVKGIDWKRDEKVYRDISSDLITIKQAWRNPIMHVDRDFSIEEAVEIFRAVQSFMQRLAAQLPVVSDSPPE